MNMFPITAKLNGLEPYWYLKYHFENLPEAMTVDEFMALISQNVDKNLLAAYFPHPKLMKYK
jgi:transposase